MITQDRLKELLHYDPETGVFTWRVARPGVQPGDRTGKLHHEGYVDITADGQRYRAHRLAWLYVHGEWPRHQIDHINRIKDDNRLANLRDVPLITNLRNKPRYANASSPVVGVYPRGKKHRAAIRLNGVVKYLGTFDNLFDAVAARRSAENRYWTASSVSQ